MERYNLSSMRSKRNNDNALNHNLRFITEDRKRCRELFLLIMFELSLGEECLLPYQMVSEETLKYEIYVEDVSGYLINKGFIEWIPEEKFNHPIMPGPGLKLTHIGLLEAEKLVANRLGGEKEDLVMTKENIHTIIQNFNAPIGAVQAGPKSKAHISQYIGPNIAELLQLISQLRNEIETSTLEDKEDVLEVVDALSEEVKRDEPRRGRLRAFMCQIGEFTANTASNVIASVINKQLGLD